MKSILSIKTIILVTMTLWGGAASSGELSELKFGLTCQNASIQFSGGRYADRVMFRPTEGFLEGLISEEEIQKKLSNLSFSSFLSIGSCRKGRGDTLATCSGDAWVAALSFRYSEKVGDTDFYQTVNISRGMRVRDWRLSVVKRPGRDFSGKEIVAAHLVFNAEIESAEGTKRVRHEQKVGEWLDPIPDNRSDYGLCVFK